MKLLLKKDIPRLGIVGDIVNVAAGFARNYLLPHNLATQPTRANIKALAAARAEAEDRLRRRRDELKTTAARLADVEITIEAAANEEGVLYGSVGPREIAAALRDEGHDVGPAQVALREPIKHLDNVTVNVVLADDIETAVKVWVVRSRAELVDDDSGKDVRNSDENAWNEGGREADDFAGDDEP